MSPTRHFINNIELYLTALCVIIVFTIPVLFSAHEYWRVFGITAIIISVIHGVFFWVIRRRQRQIRDELLSAIRSMLVDRIKNKLMVVLIAAVEHDDFTQPEDIEAAISAVSDITKTLDQLSLDSLRRWEYQYSLTSSAF